MSSRDEVARLQQRMRAPNRPWNGPARSPRQSQTGGQVQAGDHRQGGDQARRRLPGKGHLGTSETAKPSTRTRTGGSSSRSTASSPGTRRKKDSGGSG